MSVFLKDLLDRSARRKPSGNWVPDLWASVGIVASAISANLDALTKVASGLVGVPKIFVELAVLALCLCWCVYVVQAKGTEAAPTQIALTVAKTQTVTVYKYGQTIRNLAKLAILALVILLPTKGLNAYRQTVPLPLTFYGLIIDGTTGQPVADAQIRIFSAERADLTKGIWRSDSSGYFAVQTIRPARRDGEFAISVAGCDTPARFPLSEAYEVDHLEGRAVDGVTFRLTIYCKERS